MQHFSRSFMILGNLYGIKIQKERSFCVKRSFKILLKDFT